MSSHPPLSSGGAPADDGDWAGLDMDALQGGIGSGDSDYDKIRSEHFSSDDPDAVPRDAIEHSVRTTLHVFARKCFG